MTRKIPIISLKDFAAKAQKRKVYRSLVESVTTGVDLDLESVNIAEIKNHDIIISIPKTEWKASLENALNFYIEREEYEECTRIKNLIERL